MAQVRFSSAFVRAFGPRFHLRLAQQGVTPALPEHEPLLDAWLASLPIFWDEPPAADGGATRTGLRLGAALSADARRLTWRADGPSAEMIPPMARFLVHAGAERRELERLSALGAALTPARLGSWLELRPEGLNAGWWLPQALPLEVALSQIDNQAAREAIERWAGAHAIQACTMLGRAMGAGSPHTMLQLPLPLAGEIEERVLIAIRWFDALEARQPGDAALAALMNLQPADLAVSAWVSDVGPVKVGLLALQPELALRLELARIVGAKDYEPVAIFEGLLGVEQPAAVEYFTRAGGPMVEMHYEGVGAGSQEPGDRS